MRGGAADALVGDKVEVTSRGARVELSLRVLVSVPLPPSAWAWGRGEKPS